MNDSHTLASPADVDRSVTGKVLNDILKPNDVFTIPGQFPDKVVPLMSDTLLASGIPKKLKEKN